MAGKQGLRHGALGEGTLHLCIDMQRLFAEQTEWHVPWMERVLPNVRRLAEAHPAQTVFTRFIPPRRAEDMPGSWQRYYQRWQQMTLEHLDPALLDLVPELARLVPPATVVDKQHYSPFTHSGLPALLRERRADTLVFSGGETDVCVLAAVLDAVDRGYRVVMATDGLCSASDETHDALLALYHERFSQQIEAVDSEAILTAWR